MKSLPTVKENDFDARGPAYTCPGHKSSKSLFVQMYGNPCAQLGNRTHAWLNKTEHHRELSQWPLATCHYPTQARTPGGSPLPMNPPGSFKFRFKTTACAFTACEHVFAIDPGRVSSDAAATFIQLSTCKHQ